MSRKSKDHNNKIDISGGHKEIGELMVIINRLPDIRKDRIRAVKEEIESGTYRINTRKIAERLFEESVI